MLICFRRHPLTPEQARWVSGVGNAQTLPLNRGRGPLTLARSYLSGVPLSIERNRNPEMAALVAAQIEERQFDAILVDHWLMAQYLPEKFGGLKLLHEHNAEYIIWRREADAATKPLMRLLLQRECKRVRDYEAGILPSFDTIFAVSEGDRQALLHLGAAPDHVQVLPNLPNTELLEQPALAFAESQPVMLFLGTLSWKPNIDSATRLLTHIFPAVHSRLPEARLLLAGRGAPKSLGSLAARTAGVEFIPEVADAEALYRRARVFVEATRSGGGTKLKVLNALARGLPVVASLEGAAGLELTPAEDILLAQDEASFVHSVIHLLTDAESWQALSDSGRKLIREKYLADVAFRTLRDALSGVPARG
jgi:glycosyltransferase involved in cell wall biosynthesis